ncbi:hypothetical protein ACWEWX_22510 [Streptomyces asiaticus]
MNNKKLVLRAAAELFGKKGFSAVDRWVPGYIQHSSLAADAADICLVRNICFRGAG